MGWDQLNRDGLRNSCVWILTATLGLATLPACTSFSRLFEPKAAEKNPTSESGAPAQPVKGPESDYQWAIQSFEAGRYTEALKRFQELNVDSSFASAHGAEILYMRGRCYYHLENWAEAERELQSFLTRYPESQMARDARIYLLLIYNQQRNWSRSTALAAEAGAQEGFVGNRILIKLLWTEALAEQSEIAGARSAIAESKVLLEAIPEGSLMGEVYGETNESLRDRAKWLAAHVELRNCTTISPLNPNGGKLNTRTAQAWMVKVGACWRQATDQALKAFPEVNPRWRRALMDSLQRGFEFLAESPAQLSSTQAFSLDQAVELTRPELRKTLYAIQSKLDQFSRTLETPNTSGQNRPPNRLIQDLTQKLDGILQKISVDAAKSDRQF